MPVASCSAGETSVASFWVGIDGASGDGTVEQIGTYTGCNSGSPYYEAWWEMYGTLINLGLPVVISTSQYPVSAGDTMSASVNVSGSTWTLSIGDDSKGWNFATNQSLSPAPGKSSAEWIVEDPSHLLGGSAPFTHFGSTTFTGAIAIGNGTMGPISSFYYVPLGASNSNDDLQAGVSALGPIGESFIDTWHHD